MEEEINLIKRIAKKYREKMKDAELYNYPISIVGNSIEEMAEFQILINAAIRFTTYLQ